MARVLSTQNDIYVDNQSQDIIILPFQPENQSEVKNLISAGLAEHWGTLDSTRNPDLDNMVLPMLMLFFWLLGKTAK
jgi:hypothetical protein